MSKRVEAKPKKIDNGIAFRLWIGMLLPPAAWAAQLQSLYLTSEFGCKSSNFTWNHVVVVAALALSLLGGAIAWREWLASGATNDAEGSDRMSRRRFMAMLGILTSALFTVTIFAQWLPTLVGVPCDK
jgi:hypothetical protein